MTEGVMVFARTSKGASRLSEAIRNGDFKKEYVAAVEGKLEGTGHLENYLYKDERTNTSSVVSENKKGAKLAALDYTVIGHTNFKGKEYTYVRIKLHTGRHHQIRVQMSNIGHPLFGDVKYGGTKGELALFACSLKFIHPTKDDIMEFNAMPDITGIWEDINGANRN
jgi:23S rRNA pseudouridine1911/1915/1917 synthase